MGGEVRVNHEKSEGAVGCFCSWSTRLGRQEMFGNIFGMSFKAGTNTTMDEWGGLVRCTFVNHLMVPAARVPRIGAASDDDSGQSGEH